MAGTPGRALEEVRGGEDALRTLMRKYAERAGDVGRSVCVVHFWAPWCEPCAHMDEVMLAAVENASTKAVTMSALRCEAEEEGDLSDLFTIEAVPTFVALRLRGSASNDPPEELGRVEGASPTELAQLTDRIAARPEYKTAAADIPSAPSDDGEDLNARLSKLVKRERIMLFMKGKPSAPRCGFSKRVANALADCYESSTAEGDTKDALFGNFDILGDEEVRQGLKAFSNWPTFPQLYVDGELIGGCDIIMEMYEAGELKELIRGD